MKAQDIQVLVAFHNQYDRSSGECGQCHFRVPVEQLTVVTLTVDEHGFADKELLLCGECIRLFQERQEETDRTADLQD